MQESRERSIAARQQMLERFRSHHAAVEKERSEREAAYVNKRKRFSTLDMSAAMSEARSLQFKDLEADGEPSVCRLNRPTLFMLEALLQALREGTSTAILQWPRGSRDISALHPLAMLAVLGSSAETTTEKFIWCPAVPDFRTLYYPWRGTSTGLLQRRVIVDREGVLRRNSLHLTRERVGQPEVSVELRSLHVTLGHLSRLKLRDTTMPHLAHPTIGEMYATFGALAGDEARHLYNRPKFELFGRVCYGAGLNVLSDNRGAISQAASAPFGFFGVCPRSNVSAAIAALATDSMRAPDICLLDLGPAGLSRLGSDWEQLVEQFLKKLALKLPGTPVLAITQDIYVHRRLRRFLTSPGLESSSSSSLPALSRVLVRSSEDLFSEDPDIGAVSGAHFQFHSAAGSGAAALRALSNAARRTANATTAGLLRQSMGNVRRAMGLPCGLRETYALLSERDAGAASFLERRSAGTILSVVREQLKNAVDGAEKERLIDAERAIDVAFNEFEHDTPIGSMLVELAIKAARKSSPSVFAFAGDYELFLAEKRLYSDSDCGELIARKVQSKFIRLSTLKALDIELSEIESGRSRNSWKRLIVVAPPRDQFSLLLGRRWLPEEVIVLADREFVDRLAVTYAALSTHPDLAGEGRIGHRLGAAAAAARQEAAARDVSPLELELEGRPPVIADDTIIDLTDEDEDSQEEIIEFALESGRTMRVRQGTLIIRYDKHADVNPFERTAARDIRMGDTIVIPDQAFVQEARSVLPIRVLAQTRVLVFHAAVETAIPRLPGQSKAEKARHVIKRMKALGARAVVEATVLDWLNAREHRQVPPEKMRPHAPQNWREFRAFMEVVDVQKALAETIWREGIEPLRIDRRRAGARMAQAFISVLVDPHGGNATLPADVREGIKRLRRQAMEYLDSVRDVKRQKSTGGSDE